MTPAPEGGDGGGNTLVVVESIEGRVVPPAAMGSVAGILMVWGERGKSSFLLPSGLKNLTKNLYSLFAGGFGVVISEGEWDLNFGPFENQENILVLCRDQIFRPKEGRGRVQLSHLILASPALDPIGLGPIGHRMTASRPRSFASSAKKYQHKIKQYRFCNISGALLQSPIGLQTVHSIQFNLI